MIRLKSKEEINILKGGGEKLSEIMRRLKEAVGLGVNSQKLEEMAKKLIEEAGGEPAFLGYAPNGNKKYPSALCLSINEAIVHTPASLSREIKDGDVVSLDLGFKYKGLITDMATTVVVGKATEQVHRLLDATKKALERAIIECKAGAPISAVGKKIDSVAKSAGFNVIIELVGHGVGYEVHEAPTVPNFYDKSMDTIIMEEGLVIAIEPMVALGSGKIILAKDGWTYKTRDKNIAAHFEATIAVTKDSPIVLTPVV